MRLITIEQWQAAYFSPEARPSQRTLTRWKNDPARHPYLRKVGGTWYVDEHRWLAEGDPLVERVLAAG